MWMRTRVIHITYLVGTAIAVAGWLCAIGWVSVKVAKWLLA
jgi:hypothetical protein